MDFSGFEQVDNSHPRKGGYTLIKEQAYDNMKYRRALKKIKQEDGTVKEEIEGRFYVANAKIKELDLLNEAVGLTQFTKNDTGETVLCVVAAKDATILKASKKGKKSKNFKSPKMEAALEKLGVISTSLEGENQFIDLTLVATNVTVKGVACTHVFTMAKGVAKKVEAPVATSTVADAAPASAPAPAAAAKGDWD